MPRPHVAALLEDRFFASVRGVLRARRWSPAVVAHIGYGSTQFARVMGRVTMTRPSDPGQDAVFEGGEITTRRGWRAFMAVPLPDVPVRIRLGNVETTVLADRGGYFDVMLEGHGLEPGWHQAELSAPDRRTMHADILIIDPATRRGIISDIDDTVMVTHLPRPLIAAWNTFVRTSQARDTVPGMAELYRELVSVDPGTPVIYLSTGAWNTAPTLVRFLKRYGYPTGPLLMTDWGPTNTGWFRSGQEHKRSQLARLAEEFPHIGWILIGDDGQHDPDIYGEFAAQHPNNVEVIGIRQLSPSEQVLSHGIPIASSDLLRHKRLAQECRGPDGFTLYRLIDRVRTAQQSVAEPKRLDGKPVEVEEPEESKSSRLPRPRRRQDDPTRQARVAGQRRGQRRPPGQRSRGRA